MNGGEQQRRELRRQTVRAAQGDAGPAAGGGDVLGLGAARSRHARFLVRSRRCGRTCGASTASSTASTSEYGHNLCNKCISKGYGKTNTCKFSELPYENTDYLQKLNYRCFKSAGRNDGGNLECMRNYISRGEAHFCFMCNRKCAFTTGNASMTDSIGDNTLVYYTCTHCHEMRNQLGVPQKCGESTIAEFVNFYLRPTPPIY